MVQTRAKSAPKSAHNWHNFLKKSEKANLVTRTAHNWHNFSKEMTVMNSFNNSHFSAGYESFLRSSKEDKYDCLITLFEPLKSLGL